MQQYNDTTYAILGILTTECRSGYAIKQLIDRSLNHFWKISYGQIYPTLKQIVASELATIKTSTQQGKPDRHEYELTEKGKAVLQQWLAQPIKQIPIDRNEVLLKLFFGSHQSTQQSLSLIIDYKQKLEATMQTYVAIEQSIKQFEQQQNDAKYWLMTLDYGKRTTVAAIQWCEETARQLIASD